MSAGRSRGLRRLAGGIRLGAARHKLVGGPDDSVSVALACCWCGSGGGSAGTTLCGLCEGGGEGPGGVRG